MQKPANYSAAVWLYRNTLCRNFRMDYFEVPQTNWRWVPYDKPSEPNAQYSLDNMGLDPDGYWHAAVELELWEKNKFPGLTTFDVGLRPIKFHFVIKEEDDDFVVKINLERDEHKINPDVESDFKQFYDYIYQKLKKVLEKSDLKTRLRQVEAKGRLGFPALPK